MGHDRLDPYQKAPPAFWGAVPGGARPAVRRVLLNLHIPRLHMQYPRSEPSST